MFYFKVSLAKYVYKTWYSYALFVGDTVYVQSGREDLPGGARSITETKFNEVEMSLNPSGNDSVEVK